MIPFDAETFSRLFAQYNAAIWPAQFGALVLGLTALWLAVKPRPWSGRFIAASLAAFWLWCGVVYHIQFFTTINWAAWGFGAIFAVQGIAFLWSGAVRGRLDFRFAGTRSDWFGLGLAAFAILIYPSLSWAAGRDWLEVGMFGVAPCPVTIYTFGLLMLCKPRMPLGLLVVPVLWSIAGMSTVWALARPEDLILAVAACLALGFAVAQRLRPRRF